MALQPKPHIADIQPVTHGGINFCVTAGGEERIAAPFGLAMTRVTKDGPAMKGLKGADSGEERIAAPFGLAMTRVKKDGPAMTGLKGADSDEERIAAPFGLAMTRVKGARKRAHLKERPYIRTDCIDILDFSTCCNPYGPPPSVSKALAKANIALYPDPDCREFINLLSDKIGAAKENLIATNGSTELLRLAALAYTGHGDTVVIPSPTYGEYELASQIAAATVAKYQMKERAGFRFAAGDFISFAQKHSPAAIFICNPNNPTGQYLGFSDIRKIVSSFPDTLVVLDEAYVSFTLDAWDSLELLHYPNILIVRSMTKDFALAGLRLGYGIASREIINILKKIRPPWNVNSAAQQAGIAALNSPGHLKKCNALINKGKDYLIAQLGSLGYRVLPTDANFSLVRVGKAATFQSRLLDRGFLVRDCSSFGLPAYIRIAPRRMQDCLKLIAAIKSVRGEVK